jgi:outer membrane protein TolC
MTRILFVFAMLLAAPTAWAQRTLTLDEALALARRENRDLKGARARLEQSALGVEQAWAVLLPTVSMQGKYTHNYREITLNTSAPQASVLQANVVEQTFRDLYGQLGLAPGPGVAMAQTQLEDYLRQNPPNTAPLVIQKGEQLDFVLQATVPLLVPHGYYGVAAARKQRGAAQATFEVNETAVLFSTAQAFFACAGADELLLARRHAIDVAQKTLTNAKARLEAGVVNRVEVTRAEIAVVKAEQAHREALDVQAQTYRTLATVIQLREPFRVAATGPDALPGGDPGELARNALTLRPEFMSAERTVQAADATINSAKWRWAPTISAFGLVRAFNYAGFFGDNYNWAVGVQLDWLIYDGGIRDYQRHLAQAQRREGEQRLALLRDTIADEVFNARRAVDTKRQALSAASRAVALSKETLDLVRVQHDAGTATQLDLLQAQDSLVTAEVGVAQAHFDLALSDLALRRTAGIFPAASR